MLIWQAVLTFLLVSVVYVAALILAWRLGCKLGERQVNKEQEGKR